MSDFMVERTPSSVTATAVAGLEKKAQRPDGCAGIFFQLFDWNRRFAKKKLFPKKMLPHARTKQVPKRLIADDKLPKLKHLLIVEENGGGFPSMKKNLSHRGVPEEAKRLKTRAPGLVARLMGLESLPAVQKGRKSIKGTVVDENCKEKETSYVGVSGGGLDNGLSGPEKGSGRHDSRPQKLQKTGLYDRNPVASFGADAFQIKNVLSRPRKPHHHKLVPPLKSSTVGRGTSRLVDVATRILEPGLQATSRAKSAIRYSDPSIRPLKNDVRREAESVVNFHTQSVCSGIAPFSSSRRTPCRTCGNLVDETQVKFVTEEQRPLYDVSYGVKDVFFNGISESNPRPAIPREKEVEVVLPQNTYVHGFHPPQSKAAVLATAETISNSTNLRREGPHQIVGNNLLFPTDPYIPYDVTFPNCWKQRVRAQVQKEKMIEEDSRTRLACEQSKRAPSIINPIDERKDFLAFSGSLVNCKLKFSSRSNHQYEVQRNYCGRADEPLSTPKSSSRKRTMNVGMQADDFGSASLIRGTQRSIQNRTLTGARPRPSIDSTNRNCATRPIRRACSMIKGCEDMDVKCISFSSPLRSKVVYPPEMNTVKTYEIDSASGACRPKLSGAINYSAESSQSSFLMNQDALGALLDQKLKELNLQVEEELDSGIVSSSRTPASTLQDLIAAMATARPVPQDVAVNESATRHGSYLVHTIADTAHQAKTWTKRHYTAVSLEGDYYSPGSVLEASFSSKSCFSRTIDDVSGNMPQSDCMDLYVADKRQSAAFTAADISESASSATEANIRGATIATYLHNHISMLLHNADLVNASLTETKIGHIKGVIFNTALIFGDIRFRGTNRFVNFLLGSFLDELGTATSAAWTCSKFWYEMTEKLRRSFLLDCLVEFLDLRYSRYCNTGFGAWSRLSVNMNAEVLIQAFSEEIGKWIRLVGKAIDEIVQYEMSTSMGKWTDFEIERFEIGSDVGLAIVQTLVDEVVMDLSWDYVADFQILLPPLWY